ncbi:MAG: hypothetical protein GXO11_05365, partial [Epsilonproteobacteria bacterium]|nr:hypothetical protein [Campylobacterota bacterium]
MDKKKLQETIIAVLEYLQDKGAGNKTIQGVLLELNNTINPDIASQYIDTTEEDYRRIAIESITSYHDTNKTFHDIAIQQAKEIQKIKQERDLIDVDLLQEKFSDIQEHMISEIKRANREISRLTQKVKALEEESNLDPLTKVFNRRALNTYLENICKIGKLHHEL